MRMPIRKTTKSPSTSAVILFGITGAITWPPSCLDAFAVHEDRVDHRTASQNVALRHQILSDVGLVAVLVDPDALAADYARAEPHQIERSDDRVVHALDIRRQEIGRPAPEVI